MNYVSIDEPLYLYETEDLTEEPEKQAVCPSCLKTFVLDGFLLYEYLENDNFLCQWCQGLEEADNNEYGVD